MLQDIIKEIEESGSLEPLKKLKKENLVKVAAHFGITPAVGATKSHILDLIEDYCVENNIIDEVEEKRTAETAKNAEVLKLKLEFEHEERQLGHEERRLAREEAQRAREAAEAEAQRSRDAKKGLQVAQFAKAQKAQEEAQKARDLRCL